MSGPVPHADSRRRRRDEMRRTYALLLAAAQNVFAERGRHATVDEVAVRAGVGEATLDRYFPNRGQLLVAAYADAVTRLCARGTTLSRDPAPADALFGWLRACTTHAADTRELQRRIVDTTDADHRLLRRWHESIRSTTGALVRRARRHGALRADVDAADLLLLVHGLALTGADTDRNHRVLGLLRDGVVPLGWPLGGGHAASS